MNEAPPGSKKAVKKCHTTVLSAASALAESRYTILFLAGGACGRMPFIVTNKRILFPVGGKILVHHRD